MKYKSGPEMVALLAACSLLIGTVLSTSAIVARPLESEAQVAVCPPCADQLPTGARVLGVATAQPDPDGTVQSVVAYFVRDPGFASFEIGRMGAVAVRASGGRADVYKLGEALGESPYVELAARDLNGDGGVELTVTGGYGAHSSMLRIFTWDGFDYRLLDEFFGDSGVRLSDADGDGISEVIVGVRLYDRAQLRRETLFRWSGAGYVPIHTRWTFSFDDPAYHDYPEAVVLKYYLAISALDYRTAYGLLGGGMREEQSYSAFEASFTTSREVRVEDLELVEEGPETATVRVEITSIERDGAATRYEGVWLAERSTGSWRLAGAYLTLN